MNIFQFKKQIQKLFLIIPIFLITFGVFAIIQPTTEVHADWQLQDAGAEPPGPVPPGTSVNVKWTFNATSGSDVLGAIVICHESPPSSADDNLFVHTCLGDGVATPNGSPSGSKAYTLAATTRFAVKMTKGDGTTISASKVFVVNVDSNAPVPTPGTFAISAFTVSPSELTAASGKDIVLSWQTTNPPKGAQYNITYSTVDANGAPIKGPDGKPITDLKLDIKDAKSTDNGISYTLLISQFGCNTYQGTVAGKTTFKIIGNVGTSATETKTTTLNVLKNPNVPDQSDGSNNNTSKTGCVTTPSIIPTLPTLYGFIVKIVSSIVILLTKIIYQVFSLFIVPVINALLKVHPYQDAFVNIIYPGWLILRNLSNIFFIVALLVVGLKILFQQSAATIARGFLIRLVLMALLVNFSLVIAQGVVGIADTVQSQFLPANTKVIEALGTKLMVEPIKSFSDAYGATTSTPITGDSSIGDVTKPIILLILAVAAFFSFLAILAFLAVRLVALMILYMISPIAYVGFIMTETTSYAKRWWDEFIKYAFLTPILVFFLNIAALIAVTTSSTTGNVIKIDDTLSSDLVAGGLTIASQLIVLLVIFFGMKTALSFSSESSKVINEKIVSGVKKGFKNTLKSPAWLAGYGADKAATALEKRNKPMLAKAITAAANPIDFGRAGLKRFQNSGQERRDRESKRLSSLVGIKQKGNPLKGYWDGIKEKGLSDEDPETLRDMLTKGGKEHNKQNVGEAMLQLAKTGDFDQIIDGVSGVTNKKYNKNAAGLNAAMKDVQKEVKMSDEEATSFMKNFDSQAKKNKNRSQYAGNITRTEDGTVKIRELDSSDPKGKFTAEDHSAWVQKQVDGRLKMGISEDLRQTDLASMVAETDTGYGLTDTQLGLMSKVNLSNLTSPDTINKFRSGPSDKLEALQTAYESSGRAKLQKKLLKELNPFQVTERMQALDNLYLKDPKKQTNTKTQTVRQQTIVNAVGEPNDSNLIQSSQMDAAQSINRTVKFAKNYGADVATGTPTKSEPSRNPTSQQGQASSKPDSKFEILKPLNTNKSQKTENNTNLSDENKTAFKDASKDFMKAWKDSAKVETEEAPSTGEKVDKLEKKDDLDEKVEPPSKPTPLDEE